MATSVPGQCTPTLISLTCQNKRLVAYKGERRVKGREREGLSYGTSLGVLVHSEVCSWTLCSVVWFILTCNGVVSDRFDGNDFIGATQVDWNAVH